MSDTDVLKNPEDDTGLMKRKKRKLLLNFTALCCVWLFSFTAFCGLQNLQSSIHAGSGIISLIAVTIGGVISCTIAPAIISYIGCKGALILSCIGLTMYTVANYYPKPYILITGGGITGLASGLMWTVQGCYITSIGYDYHKLTNETFGAILSKLYGIFFMAFQSTQIWGNLISSVVFQYKDSSLQFSNNSFCGGNFCPSDMIRAAKPGTGNITIPEAIHTPDQTHVTVLISIYLAFSVISLFVAIFALKPIQSSLAEKYTAVKDKFVSTLQLLISDVNILLIIPIFFYTGIELVVMFVQFTTVS